MPLDGIDHHPRRQRIIAAETLEHGAIFIENSSTGGDEPAGNTNASALTDTRPAPFPRQKVSSQ
jgi:hypothetical protein